MIKSNFIFFLDEQIMSLFIIGIFTLIMQQRLPIFNSFALLISYGRKWTYNCLLKLKIFTLKIVYPITLGQSVFAIAFIFTYSILVSYLLRHSLEIDGAECMPKGRGKSKAKEEGKDAFQLVADIFAEGNKAIENWEVKELFKIQWKKLPEFCSIKIPAIQYQQAYQVLPNTFPFFTLTSVKGYVVIDSLMGNVPARDFYNHMSFPLEDHFKMLFFYTSVLQHHFEKNLNLIATGNKGVTIEAFKQIIYAMPFYLEFQLKSINPFLSAMKYPYSVDHFFKFTFLAQTPYLDYIQQRNMDAYIYNSYCQYNTTSGIEDRLNIIYPAFRAKLLKEVITYLEIKTTSSSPVLDNDIYFLPIAQIKKMEVELQQQIVTLKEEVSEKEELLNKTYVSLRTDRQELLEAKIEKAAMLNNLKELTDKSNQYKTNEASYMKEINQLKHTIDDLNQKASEDNQTQKQQIDKLQRTVDDLNNTVYILQKERETLNETINKYQHTIDSQRKDITNIELTLNKTIETQNKKIQTSETQTQTIETQNKEIQTFDIQSQESQTIEMQKQEITTLKSTIGDKDKEIDQANENINKINQDKDNLGSNFNELTQLAENLQRNIQNQKQEIENLNMTIQNQRQEIEDLTRDIQNQKLISPAFDKSINDQTQTIHNLQNQIDNLRQTIEAKNQEMAKLKSTMENKLQQEVEEKMDLLKYIDRQSTSFETLQKTNQEENDNPINNKNKVIVNLHTQLDEQNSEMEKIKKQLAQKDLNNKWLQLQVKKNNLINQGHYQYAGMATMGLGIVVTGSYLLSKCF